MIDLESEISEAFRAAGLSSILQSPIRVENFGGHASAEVIISDAADLEAAKKIVSDVVKDSDVYVTVRSVWRIERVDAPQVAYGPNGSPRAAVLVPVVVRSGEIEALVTVAITKLAEMGFEQILGTKPDLRRIATLVIEGALKLGGTSFWNPPDKDYFEVASDAVADLSRNLRKIA